MTSTELDPTTWKTPKTDSRNRRGVPLPAEWRENAEGTETVFRIVSEGVYRPAYVVGAGWGRIAVEQEIEAIDANFKRRWTVEAAAVHAIFALPGYAEIDDED